MLPATLDGRLAYRFLGVGHVRVSNCRSLKPMVMTGSSILRSSQGSEQWRWVGLFYQQQMWIGGMYCKWPAMWVRLKIADHQIWWFVIIVLLTMALCRYIAFSDIAFVVFMVLYSMISPTKIFISYQMLDFPVFPQQTHKGFTTDAVFSIWTR